MFHSVARFQYHPCSTTETPAPEGHCSGFACRNNDKTRSVRPLLGDLVSLLIFWRKSHLSRFAEMVSQTLGSLRVDESTLEVLVGAAEPGARRINAVLYRRFFRQWSLGPPWSWSWTLTQSTRKNTCRNKSLSECHFEEHIAQTPLSSPPPTSNSNLKHCTNNMTSTNFHIDISSNMHQHQTYIDKC